MHPTHLLQLDIPLPQLLGRETKAVLLVRDIVVLAEDTSQITSGEEDGARAVVALETGFFAEVGGDGVYDDICSYQACPCLLESVDAA